MPTDAFYGGVKGEKMFCFCDLFIFKKSAFAAVINNAKFFNKGCERGTINCGCQKKVYWFRKEVPFFCQKWIIKNRGWTSGQSLPYKTLLSSLRFPSFPFLLI